MINFKERKGFGMVIAVAVMLSLISGMWPPDEGEWEEIKIPPLAANANFPQTGSVVFFLDTQIGWVASFGQIFKTTDGGGTWTVQFQAADLPTARREAHFNDLWFVNAQRGFAVEGVSSPEEPDPAVVYETSDGGQTWTKSTTLVGTGAYAAVKFVDGSNGWIDRSIRGGSTLLRSGDAGNTWTPTADPLGGDEFDFISSTRAVAIGGVGRQSFVKTSNGGATWSEFNFGKEGLLSGEITLAAISFVNQNEGWIAAQDSINLKVEGKEDVIILHTSNGGASWDKRGPADLKGVGYPRTMKFISQNEGWLATSGGNKKDKILHTNDGGKTWKVELKNTEVSDMFFTAQGHGFAVGPEGVLLRRKVK